MKNEAEHRLIVTFFAMAKLIFNLQNLSFCKEILKTKQKLKIKLPWDVPTVAIISRNLFGQSRFSWHFIPQKEKPTINDMASNAILKLFSLKIEIIFVKREKV